MNTDPITSLAGHLAKNPTLLVEAEELAMRDLLLDHSVGLLEPAIAAEAEALIQNDPLAASIWAEYQATDDHLKTEAGQEWLNASRDPLLSQVVESQTPSVTVVSHAETPQRSQAASIKNTISSFFHRIKAALSPHDSTSIGSGWAYAHSEAMEEFQPHFDGQVVTRLWKNEAGKTMLWLITKNADYTTLHYQFSGEPSVEVQLLPKGNRWVIEIELDTDFVASAHPRITRTSH